MSSRTSLLTNRGRTTIVAGLAASWLAVTAVSQHPNQYFDRTRSFDVFGILIPNWRFFAPEPAQKDFHVLHRTLDTDGVSSPWISTTAIAERTLAQSVYFPTRRAEKAIFDIASQLVTIMASNPASIETSPPFNVLKGHALRAIEEDAEATTRIKGFQFLVAQHTGHEDTPDPDYVYLSPYISYDGNNESLN